MKTYLIGDVHSQSAKLDDALSTIVKHSDDNTLVIFLGDLFDSRSELSDSVEVYNLVRQFQREFGAVVLNSNHQDKLRRYLRGNRVRIDLVPELGRTIKEFEESDIDRESLLKWLESCPYGYIFKDSKMREYRCAHAYFPTWVGGKVNECHGREILREDIPRKAQDLMLYGKVNFETRERIKWWESESERQWVRIAGHYHVVHFSKSSIVLDGCCGNENGKLPVYEVESGQISYF